MVECSLSRKPKLGAAGTISPSKPISRIAHIRRQRVSWAGQRVVLNVT